MDDGPDLSRRLAEHLLQRRIVMASGVLDHQAADRAASQLLLLDAQGPGPVELHLRCSGGDLDAAATLADAVRASRAPLRAVAMGVVGGAAVWPYAAADERVASRTCAFQLSEPRLPAASGRADEVEAVVSRYRGLLAQFHEQLAAVTGRGVEEVAADLRAGRVLTALDALAHGLVQDLV